MPTIDFRNRLRIAHERSASAQERVAEIHDEAAAFWEQIQEPARAAEHRREVARHLEAAALDRAEAEAFSKPA